MREPRYNILADIQDATEQAKQGKLALYWQRTIQREYRCKKVTPAEQQAYEQLQSVLSEMPQWSDDEELRSEMEEIGGRVRFCHFWTDHDSMVQLTENRNGGFHAAYVLDTDASPEVRREAALLAQKELSKCIPQISGRSGRCPLAHTAQLPPHLCVADAGVGRGHPDHPEHRRPCRYRDD